MNYYNLDTRQALHAATHDEMVIVVPIEQPPEGFIFYQLLKNGVEFYQPVPDKTIYQSTDINGENIEPLFSYSRIPYPIGARIGLRETWGKKGYFDREVNQFLETGDYLYKASYNNELIYRNWLSLQCQPIEAIRHWCTVTSARVDRVQNLNGHDFDLMTGLIGLASPDKIDCLKEDFNARYSTPKPIKENGEIVGYECYAWDCESFNYDKLTVNYTFDGWLWKGKPLTIHANPFVEIFTVRKE